MVAVDVVSGVGVVVVLRSGSGSFGELAPSVLGGGGGSVVPSGGVAGGVVVALSGCSGPGGSGLGELLPSVLAGVVVMLASGVVADGVVVLSGCSGSFGELPSTPGGDSVVAPVSPSGVFGAKVVIDLSGLLGGGSEVLPSVTVGGGSVVAPSGVDGVVVGVVLSGVLVGGSGVLPSIPVGGGG